MAKYEYINGVHVINPGSISQSRSSMEETYAEKVIIDDPNFTWHHQFQKSTSRNNQSYYFLIEVAMAFFSL